MLEFCVFLFNAHYSIELHPGFGDSSIIDTKQSDFVCTKRRMAGQGQGQKWWSVCSSIAITEILRS